MAGKKKNNKGKSGKSPGKPKPPTQLAALAPIPMEPLSETDVDYPESTIENDGPPSDLHSHTDSEEHNEADVVSEPPCSPARFGAFPILPVTPARVVSPKEAFKKFGLSTPRMAPPHRAFREEEGERGEGEGGGGESIAYDQSHALDAWPSPRTSCELLKPKRLAPSPLSCAPARLAGTPPPHLVPRHTQSLLHSPCSPSIMKSSLLTLPGYVPREADDTPTLAPPIDAYVTPVKKAGVACLVVPVVDRSVEQQEESRLAAAMEKREREEKMEQEKHAEKEQKPEKQTEKGQEKEQSSEEEKPVEEKSVAEEKENLPVADDGILPSDEGPDIREKDVKTSEQEVLLGEATALIHDDKRGEEESKEKISQMDSKETSEKEQPFTVEQRTEEKSEEKTYEKESQKESKETFEKEQSAHVEQKTELEKSEEKSNPSVQEETQDTQRTEKVEVEVATEQVSEVTMTSTDKSQTSDKSGGLVAKDGLVTLNLPRRVPPVDYPGRRRPTGETLPSHVFTNAVATLFEDSKTVRRIEPGSLVDRIAKSMSYFEQRFQDK